MDGRSWYHVDEICRIDYSTDNWILHKESQQLTMRCGAQCVNGTDEVMVNVTNEYGLYGKDTQSVTLPVYTSDGFCFVTHARSWYEGGGKLFVKFIQFQNSFNFRFLSHFLFAESFLDRIMLCCGQWRSVESAEHQRPVRIRMWRPMCLFHLWMNFTFSP